VTMANTGPRMLHGDHDDGVAARNMTEASFSNTPLMATFQIKLNGETLSIRNIGQADRFITNLSSVEWMEFSCIMMPYSPFRKPPIMRC
jgi:hypothetical protein